MDLLVFMGMDALSVWGDQNIIVEPMTDAQGIIGANITLFPENPHATVTSRLAYDRAKECCFVMPV